MDENKIVELNITTKKNEEKEKKDELVICIYDENGPSINEKILEVFRKYIKSNLQNINS